MKFCWGFVAFASSTWPSCIWAATDAGTSVPNLKSRGMLTMRSMRVANTAGEGSNIYFGPGSEYSIGADSSSNFVVQKASENSPMMLLDSANKLHLTAQQVQALYIDALGGLTVRGVKQWQLVQSEDFSSDGTGWSRHDVSQCGGVHMLGGYCRFSSGEVNKTFAALPSHKQLRIVATYHFIDRWIGEAGYLKLDIGPHDSPVIVWSEQHAQEMSKNGLSICGQKETPEGKFAVSIDISVPHVKDTVQLSFGSTMDDTDPCDESWGVSNIEVYVRS